jgi:hypothetical protein
MADSKDVADQIAELVEEGREREAAEAAEAATSDRRQRFQRRAALAIAIIALLLAINSLGNDNAGQDTIDANIRVTDTYAFYQAKNIRQTDYRLAAEQLEALLPLLPPEQQAQARQRIDSYLATAARYESEPDPSDPENPLKGEGKTQLLAQARQWEAKRDQAQQRGPSFGYAGALLQIAIVLGSVAILAVSRPVLAMALGLAALGSLLMLNGYFMWFDLPFG